MNKRLILYFVVLMAAFYFINQWFAPETKPTYGQNVVTQVGVDPTLGKIKSLSPEDESKYNIARLFSGPNLNDFVAFSVQEEFVYVAFAWDKQLPAELYAKYDASPSANINRLDLDFQPKGVSNPVTYSGFKGYKLKVPHVPILEESSALLFFVTDGGKVANVVPATLYQGEVVKVGVMPENESFVLIQDSGKYYPYAVFDPSTSQTTPLIEFPGFESRSVLIQPYSQNGTTSEFKTAEEPLYVLENEFQQLVFSRVNGAIVEINLPFKSTSDRVSVVRQISFDRILEEKYPNNDQFPQDTYRVPSANSQGYDLKQPVLGGYYPLLRRNMIGLAAKPVVKIPPHLYAFSLKLIEPEQEAFVYELKRFQKDLIEFELVLPNRRIIKTYTLPPYPTKTPYCFNLDIKVEGDARGIILTTGVPEVELISDSFTPTLKFKVSRNQKQTIENISPPKKLINYSHMQPDWYSSGNGFFGLIIDPLTDMAPGFGVHPIPGEIAPTRLSVIDSQYDRFPPSKYPAYQLHLPLAPQSGVTTKLRVFAGPFDKSILNGLDQVFTDPKTGENPQYIQTQSFHGWFAFISEPFAKFLFVIMNFFHTVTGSWGFSIILLTVVLRIILYPLNNWSIKSTIKLQQISPKVAAIQEKYKKDPKHAQVEIMNLYREKGVNPFSGCIPLLIQMPFLIGMFDLLKSTFELRGAPFIPGWIDNLTAPDTLFSWSYPIIFFGNSFHLLPILLGVVMYLQQRYSASSANTTGEMTDQQKQQKLMGNIMVIVFSVMFYHFPSGLNIYWLSSMLLGILQQWWTTKRMQPKIR